MKVNSRSAAWAVAAFLAAAGIFLIRGSARAAVIFAENPDVLNDTSGANPAGWATTGHPSYLSLVDENDTPSLFTTPDGSQVLNCYNVNQTSFVTTTSSILSDTVSLGTTYTLSFNVSKTGGSVGEYYAAILAVDGVGTETVLGYTSGDNSIL